MMNKIFETKITQVGIEAQNMIRDAKILILFGEEAPADLAEYCFKINNKKLSGTIEAGGQLIIDDQCFPITSVGNLVEKNLINLGHITISFDDSTGGSLPGTLHVKSKKIINIKLHSIIQILV